MTPIFSELKATLARTSYNTTAQAVPIRSPSGSIFRLLYAAPTCPRVGIYKADALGERVWPLHESPVTPEGSRDNGPAAPHLLPRPPHSRSTPLRVHPAQSGQVLSLCVCEHGETPRSSQCVTPPFLQATRLGGAKGMALLVSLNTSVGLQRRSSLRETPFPPPGEEKTSPRLARHCSLAS